MSADLPARTASGQLAIRRIGVVANFKAGDSVKAGFDAAVTVISTTHLATREVPVLFEAASFDVARIEADRATINEVLFRDVDAIVLPTLTARSPMVDEARASGALTVPPTTRSSATTTVCRRSLRRTR